MNPDLWIALQITLIGMSVVFGCILLLWLLMTLLMRWTSREKNAQTGQELQNERKRRAAIAAVSVALAHQPAANRSHFLCPRQPLSAPGRL